MIYVWTDLETTGVGANAQIIEVYMTLTPHGTGPELELLVKPTIPKHDWDGTALAMHEASGLVNECKQGISQQELMFKVRKWLVDVLPFGERAVLAGASVHNDQQWLQRVIGHDLLSHRVYDTSTVRALAESLGVKVHGKPMPHRAKPDTLLAYDLDQHCRRALDPRRQE